MNDAPLTSRMSASSLSGTCWPPGVAIEDVADRLGRLAEPRLQAHDEVEELLALNDLRGRAAADRRLDERR